MTVSRTKQITTVIFSLAIVGMLFAIFVLFYNSSQEETVTYLVDEINSCGWEDGVVVSSTEAAGPITTVSVDPLEEQQYLDQAEANGTCTAKLGSDAGAYAAQLNQTYELQ